LRNVRLIARLDVKAPNLVKGIQMEGLRKLGDPYEFAKEYYKQGIDEILYTDIVASLYERNSLLDLIKKTTRDIFVPITVGGGLRSLDDVAAALRAGADKVAINTAAIKNPKLITEVARRFGSQCMVHSIQAKQNRDYWEAYYDNGREHSGLDAVEWAKRGEELGSGEILLTSVDREGTAKGFDLDLIKAVTKNVSIPVIASGGMGELKHFSDAVLQGGADAVAMAHVLHYGLVTVDEVRQQAIRHTIPVRIPGG
jgi:cyclase